MKPSSNNNDFLSQHQLEDYLRGNLDAEGKTRVQQLLDDCELSKEAVAGYTAVPFAIDDIPALKKSIAAKSGMTASFWMNVFVISLGTVLLAGMTYVLWPHNNDQPKITQIPVVDSVSPVVENNAPLISQVDLTPKSEHFVNPEMHIAPKAKISAGVMNDSASAKTNGGSEPKNSSGKDLKRHDTTLVVPVVPKNPEMGYNASIGFILDLKVTEFEKYAHKTISVDDTQFTGVSAQFDNFADAKDHDQETVREIPVDQFLNEGLKAFHDGHYGRCIEKMEVLQKYNAGDLNAAFYMGVSYVKLEMYEKAIPLFDQILNSPNNVFHEEANWYKALALIGNGNTEAAKKVLTEISQKDGFYKEKAAEKLKAL
jgi:hypothetical protein